METNFVREYRWARLRICSNARSLLGSLNPCKILEAVVQNGLAYAPIFVQETHHSRTLLVVVVLFIDLAGLRYFSGVILPSDRIHPPETCLRLILTLFGEPLSSVDSNKTFSFVVWGIFA